MQFIQMIWNGIGGLGAGTVLLKALFILVCGGIFWVFCELVKHAIDIFSKLAVDIVRYLAIVFRGWPQDDKERPDDKKETSGTYRVNR